MPNIKFKISGSFLKKLTKIYVADSKSIDTEATVLLDLEVDEVKKTDDVIDDIESGVFIRSIYIGPYEEKEKTTKNTDSNVELLKEILMAEAFRRDLNNTYVIEDKESGLKSFIITSLFCPGDDIEEVDRSQLVVFTQTLRDQGIINPDNIVSDDDASKKTSRELTRKIFKTYDDLNKVYTRGLKVLKKQQKQLEQEEEQKQEVQEQPEEQQEEQQETSSTSSEMEESQAPTDLERAFDFFNKEIHRYECVAENRCYTQNIHRNYSIKLMLHSFEKCIKDNDFKTLVRDLKEHIAATLANHSQVSKLGFFSFVHTPELVGVYRRVLDFLRKIDQTTVDSTNIIRVPVFNLHNHNATIKTIPINEEGIDNFNRTLIAARKAAYSLTK